MNLAFLKYYKVTANQKSAALVKAFDFCLVVAQVLKENFYV